MDLLPVLDQDVWERVVPSGGVCGIAGFQQEDKVLVDVVFQRNTDVQRGAEQLADRAGRERLAEV